MNNNKFINGLLDHINKNLFLYIIALLFLCIGIVVGIYTVKYMDSVEKNTLMNYFLRIIKGKDVCQADRKIIFFQAIKNNLLVVGFIWFLGLTMLGIPVILAADLFKGFTIGFTTSLIINELGTKGLFFNLIGLFPQNIIYIPCIIICSVIAMEFSLMLINNNKFKDRKTRITEMAIYSTLFLVIIGFMCIGFIVEGYVAPNMLKYVVANFGSDLV